MAIAPLMLAIAAQDIFVIVVWGGIMAVVGISKMLKARGDNEDEFENSSSSSSSGVQSVQIQREYQEWQLEQQQQEEQQQQREHAQQLQAQEEGRQHQQAAQQAALQSQRPRQPDRPQAPAQKQPATQVDRQTAARALIKQAIQRQSTPEPEYAPVAEPADHHLADRPSLKTTLAQSSLPTGPAIARNARRRRVGLGSQRDIRNAIILREVFDRPRAYDI
jgi:TolA-binding protein